MKRDVEPDEDYCVLMTCYVCVQQLTAELLWTVDTQKSQQSITNVVAKRALGML